MRPSRTALFLALLALPACGGDKDETDPTDATDGDADTDADADSDTDTDADTDVPESLWLTVLHTNDGESQLLPGGDEGGIARFVTKAHALQADGWALTPATGTAEIGVITVTSGDNFLAGPEFQVGLDAGPPFYDALALEAIGFDALCLGNHDFDFGPDVTADFIESFTASPPPFLSANLDVSAEPRLDALATSGRIARSTTVAFGDWTVGIVGATTEVLASISSPRDVVVSAVQPAVQAEIDALTAAGVEVIVLVSHLQSIEEDKELAGLLSGIDVMIAGGGDELLANAGTTPLLPSDQADDDYDGVPDAIVDTYPILVQNADGVDVPVVTTSGGYGYIGRLVVEFDAAGALLQVDASSDAVRVVSTAVGTDGVTPDPTIESTVEAPVASAVAALAKEVVAVSGVDLDGLRANVRTQETNQGDLIADALLWQAVQLAPGAGLPTPMVALQNGGGIRNDAIVPAGPLSVLDTFDMLPFSNFLAVVPDVPRDQLREVLENCVSRVEFVDGRFCQVAGLSLVWDPAEAPRTLDPKTGAVLTPGSRVRSVVLDDGTPLVVNGNVLPGAAVTIATIDFLARGGDQYPLVGLPFTTLGVSYQQALADYLTVGLSGSVTPLAYPPSQGRITSR